MRTVVSDRSLLEGDVKPQKLLDEYWRLLSLDMKEIIGNSSPLESCPGCGGGEASESFRRFGILYLCCSNCQTLYASSRLSEDELMGFYRHARSAVFWRDKFLPETMETRRVELFQPRAQWLLDVVDEYCPTAQTGISVGFHNYLLIQELKEQEDRLFPIAITNRIADLEFGGQEIPGVTLAPKSIAELSELDSVSVLLAFDFIDRCVDPGLFFAQAYKLLEPGGIMLATTTLGSGFDIQVLWDQVEGIYPPERLNLFSVEGLTVLFEKHGFEALEFSTPGMFDVDTVRNVLQAHGDSNIPRFIRYLLSNRDTEAFTALQEYLQRFRLSSFGRIVLRKKN